MNCIFINTIYYCHLILIYKLLIFNYKRRQFQILFIFILLNLIPLGKTEEKERLIHSSTSSNESTDSRGNPISEPCRAKRAHFASKSNPKQRHSARVTRQKPPLILKQTSSLDIELVKGSGMTAPAAGDFRQKLKSVSPTAAKKLCISNGKVNSKGNGNFLFF